MKKENRAAILMIALLLTACNSSKEKLNRNISTFLTINLLQKHQGELSYKEFKDQAFQETFREVKTGVYIINGDTPANTEAKLHEIYNAYISTYKQVHFNGDVKADNAIVYNADGVDIVWNATEKLQLTYCISDSFGSRKSDVVQAMTDASFAWENAANINFSYSPSEDANCSASDENVVFDIQPTNGQSYIARSFYPHDERWSRNIMIDDSAFNVWEPMSLTGFLRHELGHILGLRHEHTRPEPGVCFEDNNWRSLNEYDPGSVMHYPECNGTGDYSFSLSALDKEGVVSLYGPIVTPAIEGTE